MRSEDIARALAEPRLGQAVRRTTDRLAGARRQALKELADSDGDRLRARAARQAAVSRLPQSLARFQEAAEAHGVHVHYAADGPQAVRIILDILDAAGARQIVKSKSMATEEVGLRAALERSGREVVETDLGEWIVQLAGQTPSHLIVPAVHLDRQTIRGLLSAVAGRDLGEETASLVAFARRHLRERFLAADAGISGANLLVAETGTLVIVSNEGNARMCTTLPPLHIALVGVEKVVPSWRQALDVLRVLPRSATGQAMTTYVSWLTAPRRAPETDGPQQMHVVLLDNGRSRLVGTPMEELLYCIRCGACLNVCPVYRSTGGHAYGAVYSGPIGAALTPHLTQGRQGRELPWASSLCGACREACPVGIALDDQLIALRGIYPRPGVAARAERMAVRLYAATVRHPRRMAGGLRLAHALLGRRRLRRLPGPLAGWTQSRSLRPVAGRQLPATSPLAPLRPLPPPATPPDRGPQAPPPAWESFAQRWEANGGHFVRIVPQELAGTLQRLLAGRPCAADEPLRDLLPPVVPPPQAAVGVVAPLAAAADTASFVLAAGPGRARSTSLLPERVLFVLPESRFLPDLTQAMAAAGLLGEGEPPGAVVLVSGPSRSADIENDQTIGVHGPGDVWAVCIAGDQEGGADR